MDFIELKKAIEEVELVDAHAHNITSIDSGYPFVNCFSITHSAEALSFASNTLSFKRSVRDLTELYGCKPSLEGIEEYRRTSGLHSICLTCFKAARISTILIDDGLKLDKMHNLEWHRSYAPVIGRFLRIETVAEDILNQGLPDGSAWTLDKFTTTFDQQLKSHAGKIFGFKSIAAYRSGLAIDTSVSKEDAEEGLDKLMLAGKPVRIANKAFIDYIFLHSLEVAVSYDLPMQIHTGFGDEDLDLRLANPLHLRSVLEDKRFSKCRLVILHASYPFSREASYLASVYPQVYLDFGLAIPKLSVHGMISSVKELLELASIKKVMFSTDGCGSPETFYLGAKRAREVIFHVLRDACMEGDLSIPEAVEAAKDIFSRNSIHFYKINSAARTISSPDNISLTTDISKTTGSAFEASFIRVIWVDASGQRRCRVVPSKRFHNTVTKNGVGLTFAAMGMPSFTDGPCEGTNLSGVGEIRLMPDLSTKRAVPWSKQEEMVLADMHIKPGVAWDYCPRESLRRVSKVLKDEFDLELSAGFENEFVLLKSVMREGKEEWTPIHSAPYCATSAFDAASPILLEIAATLQSLNIEVEQLHTEAGKGQYEIALAYTKCSSAADYLIFTREVIKAIARKHGLLATFMPKYALDDVGSGSHVHLSLWRNGQNVFMGSSGSSKHGMSTIGEEFMAGVLYHLPAILAFTAPLPNSYDRIQPNTWSGAYRCWGKENREAPLRTSCPPGIADGLVSNFEIKSFDGCANPHIGLAAIIAAGMDGLRRHLPLPEPIDTNPSSLEDKLQRLPASLSESLQALHKDDVFTDLIGENLLVAIKGIRKAEIDYYSEHKDAYKQLIHRY